MAYEDFKDFPTKPAADKELLDKVFNIDRNPSYGGYQCILASFFINLLIKSLPVVVFKIKLC